MSSSQNPNSLYPVVDDSNPEATTYKSPASSSPSIYPSIEIKDMAENLFPEEDPIKNKEPTATLESSEEILVTVPNAIVHLVGNDDGLELASGDLTIVGLRQGGNIVAVLARVGGDAIQWPLARDEPAVKLDESHYLFSLRVPAEEDRFEALNYGVTVPASAELDRVLEQYSCFSVADSAGGLELALPEEGERGDQLVRASSAAYWATLAPNVEDYSTRVAKMIAGGSGQLIRGILWCGDTTVGRLRWGEEFLRKRLGKGPDREISPETLRRVQRVKKLTKRSEKVALGILSGVVKVSGFFTSSIVNSKPGKKFFNLMPGEIVLASLDGFSKVCDALEVAGRNVMSTSSVVTTSLVSQRYGEKAGHVTNEGLDAAGHAMGTAWAVLKIRKALNPKSVIKPTTLAKAASEASSKTK